MTASSRGWDTIPLANGLRPLLNNCQDCLTKLAAKLTQLIPDATAVPMHQIQHVVDEEPLLESYSRFIKDSL